MRLVILLSLFVLVPVASSRPCYSEQGKGVPGRVKRQQVNALPVHLRHGHIETRKGIIFVKKQGNKKEFNVVHIPVLQNKQGVPFEITAMESGNSYLTGPALRILGSNNKYDAKNPTIFFPILNTDHSEK
ncbi:uncharacterized protein LOC116294691 [Actinia tenebrosa]|uniref:Uncharacterized protein LOC116294691 n=1 Tax=Actinia tenebrosa TaxID=6105 RepID=A0A6P8I019_ACTTE|nr:uncharacterized protein LOC116294691 [Actinia tenebrosa]